MNIYYIFKLNNFIQWVPFIPKNKNEKKKVRDNTLVFGTNLQEKKTGQIFIQYSTEFLECVQT